MHDKSDDSELIKAAIDGDMSSFKALVQRYEGKVAGITHSMLGDCPESCDVGQEVFIRFYESMSKFKGESSLGTYLVRIAINLSLNELRRRKRKSELFRPIEDAVQLKENNDPENTFMEMIQAEMEHLDPEFRSVVSLRLVEGYSTSETAEILQVPLGTVLSRLYRAQKKLKEVLSKYSRHEQS